MDKRILVGLTIGALVVSTSAVANAVVSRPFKTVIMVSSAADRSNAVALNGSQFSGNIAIFVGGKSGTQSMTFYIDDRSLGTPARVETLAPYDFAGTAPDGSATMLNTSTLAAGKHQVDAVRVTSRGASRVGRAVFTVKPVIDGAASTTTSTTTTVKPVTITTALPISTGTCALPNHPTPSCVGVPADVAFSKTISGDYEVTTNGAVIDGWHITGNLLVSASDVVIKNTQVDATVYNWYGSGNNNFAITDSTIGPASGCIVQPGIVEKNYVATRVLVRGHDDGFRVSDPGNVTVRDSFAKLCYAPPSVSPPDGSHSDGIQAVCATSCPNVIFEHNTIDAREVSATFMINLMDPHIANFTAKDNMLMGGAYVISSKWFSGPNYVFQGNQIVDKTWAYGPSSGEGTCSHQTWTNNSIVTIDSNYKVTSTVQALPCID